jgi:transcriptional regulator with XRE-family HTH domain
MKIRWQVTLRTRVSATQKQMANEMGVSLSEYQSLESRSGRLDYYRLRSATFAALRIAVDRDGVLPHTELFEAVEELLTQFGAASNRSRAVH